MSNERKLAQTFSWGSMKFFIKLESKQSRRERNYLATVEAKMTIFSCTLKKECGGKGFCLEFVRNIVQVLLIYQLPCLMTIQIMMV